ncbi:hypothetical protein [Liquorilactobacillus capillatus]|uniref:DUF3796 domain-containing protein n=1 Tax=Liquorilactobacillus capillatus DSM 19910 TaxID=1423731 RepID=A0A0R1MCQ1_9LACO|nr:hypothetical protein [Liquorilactobacillus capillatus]KRL01192.1 hypothetical protein FC81_GL001333 [Liquorilactobacillus capillatus DSM 19910]
MKKIIFEQIGNIGMVLLLMAALVQTVTSSSRNTILLGNWWFIFLGWIILFGILKYLYSKTARKGGYSFMAGEFSIQDERERAVSNRATVFAYKMTIIFLICAILIFAVLNLEVVQLKVLGIVLLSSGIIIGFLAYMLAWIFYDLRI